MGCLRGVRGYFGGGGGSFVTETDQVEMRSERVLAPAVSRFRSSLCELRNAEGISSATN